MPDKWTIAYREYFMDYIAKKASNIRKRVIPQERCLAVEQDLERYFTKQKSKHRMR